MERRTNPRATAPQVYMNCRLCWERIELKPDRVEPLEPGRYAYRCQHCSSSFLIRLEDILALGVDDEPAAEPD